jgi:hypothetical protein
MKKIFFFLLIITTVNSSFSQYSPVRIEDSGIMPSGHSVADGDVFLYQDWRLLNLVKKHAQINDNTFPGWRVQIFFGSGRKAPDQANDLKTKFLTKYGTQYEAYIVYDSPYFKLRVGDFRTRAEAMRFKDIIAKTFPNSWVVQDYINYPEKASE